MNNSFFIPPKGKVGVFRLIGNVNLAHTVICIQSAFTIYLFAEEANIITIWKYLKCH